MHNARRSLAACAAASLMSLTVLASPAAAGEGIGQAFGQDCSVHAHYTSNTSANSFTYDGWADCAPAASMKVWCFPVHRHSLSWHSHTGDQTSNGPANTTHLDAGPLSRNGTNGDTYKINCKLQKNGATILTAESPNFTL